MNTTNKIMIISIISCLVGLGVGALFGVMTGSQLGSSIIVQDWVNTNTNNSLEVIVAMKELRNEERESGLDKLEVHLNKLLVGLTDSYIDGFDLNKETLERIEQVRSAAKFYRQQYPRPESKDLLEININYFLKDKV
jgi:hypothetical protein